MFLAFLDRHGLTQVEFADWLGTKKGTVWRWTLPPDDPNSRAVPIGVRAFCIAYDVMPEKVRKSVLAALKAASSASPDQGS
ncbi:transcriptional regulator (plasmid) [Azospirillum brasilense]|uniref:Transcriptional regulator n=2 Tax=root TaxID=1 RepID=A0A4D8QPU0_AZOBR|nr:MULTISPECIES: transcriptional regulator [Azospirillum]MDW7555436.1 transcriptional regulator [Azospirillum brasilense]MDW7595156.1 transcriptional regulator [Azospirillum brasilense]MDW7630309.1 transcriptional regulator [Azospirillum brasilense]MDX5949677.1 transcriptional regulator [Azospirillum brasilense]QCO12898.1 transcriptional regulator [Azospirillum brasilense]